MQQWLWAIERAKEFYSKEHPATTTDESKIPHALLSPKATMSIRKPVNDQSQVLVSLSASPPLIPSPATTQSAATSSNKPKPNLLTSDYLTNDLSITSVLTSMMIRESMRPNTSSSEISDKTDIADDNPSDVQSTHSTSGDETTQRNQQHNDEEEGNQEQEQEQNRESSASSSRRQGSTSTSTSWSMPWLMSGINAFSSTSIDSDAHQEPQTLVVWPNKMESDAPKVTLENYSEDLVTGQRELRRYFACVPTDEVVLDGKVINHMQKWRYLLLVLAWIVFSASLYRQPKSNGTDSTRDNLHQNFTDHGNGFSGTIYMTQKSLWFYSCRMMTCLNAVSRY